MISNKVIIGELSPRHIRGRLTTLNTLVVTFGQVIAYVINIAFSNVNEGWRYMFGLAGIPALFQLVGKYDWHTYRIGW